jgi:DNA-binding transcriptional regulator YhcF (GntR family)
MAGRKDLSIGARYMYGKLLTLSLKNGTCWASNKYLAKFYATNVRTISRWLKELKDKDVIDIIKEFKSGRVTKRNIIVYQ